MAGRQNDRTARLAPEVNRILYVRNLPFAITPEELYEVFGRFGAVRQVRLGVGKETKGTAFVVYEDIWDAKAAQEKLSGFNVRNRYLVVLFHKEAPRRAAGRAEAEAELRALQAKHGVDGEQHPEPARGGAR